MAGPVDRRAPRRPQAELRKSKGMDRGSLIRTTSSDDLGAEPEPSSRNAQLSKLLEDVEVLGTGRTVCENRGSGLVATSAALRGAGIEPPNSPGRPRSVSSTSRTIGGGRCGTWSRTGIAARRLRNSSSFQRNLTVREGAEVRGKPNSPDFSFTLLHAGVFDHQRIRRGNRDRRPARLMRG